MIVYRLCSCDEAKEILESRSLAEIGKIGGELFKAQQHQNVSSHNYFYNQSYLHFYPSKSAIFFLRVGNNCICTYNIPDSLLEENLGEGYYMDIYGSKRMVRTPEYAININDLSFDYLEDISYIDSEIGIEDYLVDESLASVSKSIYHKEPEIKRERSINE